MRKQLIIFFVLLFSVIGVIGQEILNHEKKIYSAPDGKLYIQKTLPVYLRLATSPDDNSDSHLLKSEVSTQYSNPMYFDTEGRNTVRSPSAVDTSTHRPVYPLQDIIFEVYADGVSPTISAKLSGAKKFLKERNVFYGKDLSIEFQTYDEVSGTEGVFYSINGEPYKTYSSMLSLKEEKNYKLKYYAVDHVGNVEIPKEKTFALDLTPPVTTYEISGIQNKKYLSAKSKLVLTSTDELSGVKAIYYSISDGTKQKYNTPLSASILQKGDVVITYYAVDNVGNEEEKKTINTSSDDITRSEKKSSSGFDFYIDNMPPVIDLELIGDQFKGKYQFISERTKMKLNATDDKSGVDKVFFAVNIQLLSNTYTEPFLPNADRFQRVYFKGIDYVENASVVKSKLLYLDKTSPITKRAYIGSKFTNRDTLFITNGTKVKLFSSDMEAGVQQISYKLDESEMSVYGSEIIVEKEGYHKLSYMAKDNVNNEEGMKQIEFFVDNSAPEIFVRFSVEQIGEKTVREEKYVIYPSNSIMYIAATDNASGGEKIIYKINGGVAQSALPIKGFVPGNYEIEIAAYDVLKNKSQQTIKFAIEK